MGSAGAVILKAQVQDVDKAKAQISELNRAQDSVAEHAEKTREAHNRYTKEAQEGLDGFVQSSARASQQSNVTAATILQFATMVGTLSAAVLEARGNLHLTSTAMTTMSLARFPLAFTAGVVALGLAVHGTAENFKYLHDVAVPAAAQSEAALVSLGIVTKQTGGDVAATMAQVKGLEDAMTAKTSAAQATRTFNTMNLSLGKQRELIDSIRDGIVAMGGDVNTQLPLMALAIKRQEGELLDNMGVVSTIEMMYKSYAAAIGTTSDKLTQSQREEAVMQGVLRETAKYHGAAAAALGTHEGRVASLRTEKRKLAEEMGAMVMPFADLGVAVESLGTKIDRYLLERVKKLADPVTGLATSVQSAATSIVDQTYLIPAKTSFEQGESAQADRLMLSLQKRNQETRDRAAQAAKEGGYGPTNSAGLQDHYNRKAELDKQEADRAASEAKQRAEQVKNDQQRLAEEVARDRATIGKQGMELELAQEKLWYEERKRLAHGHKQLLLQLEMAHQRRVDEIGKRNHAELTGGATYGPFTSEQERDMMSAGHSKLTGGDTYGPGDDAAQKAAGDYAKLLAQWNQDNEKELNEMRLRARQKLQEGTAEGLRKGIEVGKAALIGDFGAAGSAVQDILESAVVSGLSKSQAVQGAIASLSTALAGPAGIAAVFGVALVSSLMKGAETARKQAEDYRKHLEGLNAPKRPGDTVGGIEYDRDHDEQVVNLRKWIAGLEENRKRLDDSPLGEGVDYHAAVEAQDKEISARKAQLKALTDVYDSQILAARAADWLAQSMKRASDAADLYRSTGDYLKGRRRELQVATGELTPQEASRLNANDAAEKKLDDVYDGIAKSLDLGPLAGTMKVDVMEELKNGRIDLLTTQVGAANAEALKNAFAALGIDKKLADLTFKTDQNRVTPGATPQNPLYSVVTNFRDLVAFMPENAAYRSGGPGTSRNDGSLKGRAINTSKSS